MIVLPIRPLLLPVLLLCGHCALQAQHTVIQQMLQEMSIDSMIRHVEQLTGVLPVDVGQGEQYILSRHRDAPGNALAEEFIIQKLTQYGLQPGTQVFSSTGRNIIAMKQGQVPGAAPVLAGAHFDAMPGGVYEAPGADDNGSGTAALLEMARVIADHDLEHPVMFVFWDEEEQGRIGSAFHAGGLAANDLQLRAVINMDAIAYDSNHDAKARIHSRPIGNSHEIADTVFSVHEQYQIGLDLLLTVPGATYSDHASYWFEDYGAVLIIEEFGADGNPYYHTPNDKVEHFNVPYYEKLARLSLAAVAALAVPIGPVGVAEMPSTTNVTIHPNPVRDHFDLWLDLGHTDQVRITLHDAWGREVGVLLDGPIPTGRSHLPGSLHGMASGLYTIRCASGSDLLTIRLLHIP